MFKQTKISVHRGRRGYKSLCHASGELLIASSKASNCFANV